MTDDLDPDLRDLIAGWTGHELPPDRYDQLVGRLESDPAFRRAFAAEVWTLAEVRVAVDGHSLALPRSEPIEPAVRRSPGRLSAWRSVAVAAGLLLAVAAGWWGLRGPNRPDSADAKLAVVLHAAGTEWDTEPAPGVGSPLTAGRFVLRSGVAVLLSAGGETTVVEGPADFELVSPTEVALNHGRVRVKVTDGSAGFTVRVPGAAVVDLGTEFGVSVLPDRTTHVAVFSGAVEVLHTPDAGPARTSGGLKARQAAVIDPVTGVLTPEPVTAHRFPVQPYINPPALPVTGGYDAQVRSAGPWGYWRFEDADKDLVPNEVPGRPALRKHGAVSLTGPAGGRSAVFRSGDPSQYLVTEGEWVPPAAGYALECWVLPEMLTPQTIAALVPGKTGEDQRHTGLVEIVGLRKYWPHLPGTVRFLNRAAQGGVDEDPGIVSDPDAVCTPYHWHHVVAQRSGDEAELYLDGKKCGTGPVGAIPRQASRWVFGRLNTANSSDPMQVHSFVGRIDEVAVYDRPLTADEIRRHSGDGSR